MVLILQLPLRSPLTQGASEQVEPCFEGMCLLLSSNWGRDLEGLIGNLNFSLSIFCHGWLLCQTFHSYLKAKQYLSREVTGKQPSPLMQKNTTITPRLKCLQGDPGTKESLQAI